MMLIIGYVIAIIGGLLVAPSTWGNALGGVLIGLGGYLLGLWIEGRCK